MNLQSLRWPILVLTAAATLGLLFGTGLLVKSRTVDGPIETLLRSSPVVASETLNHQGDKLEISVTLKDTNDLQHDYSALNDQIKTLVGTTPYTIKVVDKRTPALQDLNRRLNLYVQEALATGRFAQMADQIAAEAAKSGATAALSVDSGRVYLTVKAGGGYLYDVVDRPQPTPPQTVVKGGMGL